FGQLQILTAWGDFIVRPQRSRRPMMNGKRLFLTLGLMTGLMGLFPAGGNDADTVLRVIVDGTVVQGRRIARLDVDVEIQGQTKTFNVPTRPEILALP